MDAQKKMVSPTSSSSFVGVGAVLVVGPRTDALGSLMQTMASDGFDVQHVNSGYEALESLRNGWAHAVLVSSELIDMPVPALCRVLRRDTEMSRIPIIIMGENMPDPEVVKVLRAGADVHVDLAWAHPLILARVKSLLRRCSWHDGASVAEPEDDRIIRIGEIQIRPARHSVQVHGKPIQLTTSEFRLLMLLATKPRQVFRREQVYDALHDDGSDASERSIDSHVFTLRKKLGVAGDYVETLRGVGYRLVKPSSGEE